ncbi:Alpha/Beta hydrolase protein [Mariannaea sp. PMI_226]|nr:Alpha/Beta hydrolase protein [Mariannaea sp. PMI_226]
MLLLALLTFGLGPLCSTAQKFSVPNVNATFEKSPKPFKFHVDRDFIEDTRQRVLHARAPDFIGAKTDGPGPQNFTMIRNFWVNNYTWDDVEASINDKLQQFTILVEPVIDNATYPVPLHFVHHRSPRADAIPLLFFHGWPGSFLEVSDIIDELTHPHNETAPAFHVVAPSIPGFAFSPAPQDPGFGPVKTAHAYNELMRQLGYHRYAGQGGDIGAFILRHTAALFPKNLVSVHSNFWIQPPETNDIRRLAEGLATPDEAAYIQIIESYMNIGSGYRLMHQTEPLTLAYSVVDSPMGNLMWVYALMQENIDHTITKWRTDEIITWSMMYYIQGIYSSMRFYKEMVNDGDLYVLDFAIMPPVEVPVAITQFPHDLGYRMPLEWARRGGNNVLKRTLHDQGGHFAAREAPDALVNDMREWFGDRELSGTKVFVH